MDLTIIGHARDIRVDTPVIYAQMKIEDYLELIREDFNTFDIQRKREKHKGYGRMKNDIANGALLPPITLAVDPASVSNIVPALEPFDADRITDFLKSGVKINILDGLQRTFILRELKAEGRLAGIEQTLLLEFWLETKFNNLIYRIIILNAGQKPMSLRHQIEVIFNTYKDVLQDRVQDLVIFTERDGGRRTSPGKFAFDRIVDAYQCFLNKSQEIKKDNVVAQQMKEEEVLSANEEEWDDRFKDFIEYLKRFVQIDKAAQLAYSRQPSPGAADILEWLGSDNVLQSFFAAVAEFKHSSPEREGRINAALDKLHDQLGAVTEPDPLGFEVYSNVAKGFNVRKVNVGNATRRLLFDSFREYFRESGEKPLKEFWLTEAQ